MSIFSSVKSWRVILLFLVIISITYISLLQSNAYSDLGPLAYARFGQVITVVRNTLKNGQDEEAIFKKFNPVRFSELSPLEVSHFPYVDKRLENISYGTKDITPEKPDEIVPKNLKKILYWNKFSKYTDFRFGFGQEPFIRAGCKVNTCYTTGNRSRFPEEEIDALMWSWRSNDRSLPSKRSPHTRYVFFLLEPASYPLGDLKQFKDLMNWTVTYRLDSDFPLPYGNVFRRHVPLQLPPDINYAKGKTKMAAWFVTHCSTLGGREVLVKTLQKWITVDVFGKCGPNKCERKDDAVCMKMLNDEYKFYFAYENSLCRDYVTEKIFNKLRLNVIPVVYGLADYKKQMPPGSYIDALSFPSAKTLAHYLMYLDKNDTAYNEYFQWKPYFIPQQNWAMWSQYFCDICERLHNDNSTKAYDIFDWFITGSHCKTKESADIHSFITG